MEELRPTRRSSGGLSELLVQSSPLYYLCSSLRSRLLAIQGISIFFQSLRSVDGQDASVHPVTQLWDLFSLGTPLCYLTSLLPLSYPRPNGSLDPPCNEHEAKLAIARFSLYMRQNFPECEPVSFSELLNRNSTEGLAKLARAVNLVIEEISASAECDSQSPPSLKRSSRRRSSAKMSKRASKSFEYVWHSRVQELILAEKQHIRTLEVIQKYSKELVENHVMDATTVAHIFPSRFFTFQRKHRIKLEIIADLDWKEQRWGRHFLENVCFFSFLLFIVLTTEKDTDLSIMYQIYCVNRAIADSEPSQVTAFELQFLASNPNVNSISSLLQRPFQQLVKYATILESLLEVSASAEHPFHEELRQGCESIRSLINKVETAQKQALSDQIVKNLTARIQDWNGFGVASLGNHVRSENFQVTRVSELHGGERRVFLFQNHLLICEEPSSNVRKKSVSARPFHRPLTIWALISIQDILRVVVSEQREDPLSPAICELTILTVKERLVIDCRTEELLRAWKTDLDHLRVVSYQPDSAAAAKRQSIDLHSGSENTSVPPPPYTPREKMIRIHYNDSVFRLMMTFPIEPDALLEKIERKLRLCTGITDWSAENLSMVEVDKAVPLIAGIGRGSFQYEQDEITLIATRTAEFI